MNSILYCKVYIDANVGIESLVSTVAQILEGVEEMNTVILPRCEIDVRKNEEFNEVRRREFPDGFLYFRYYADIEAQLGQQRESQIELVSKLLKRLWSLGFPAIASCDFEDELPQQGGYRSRSVPWSV